jgi:hypothetical protein
MTHLPRRGSRLMISKVSKIAGDPPSGQSRITSHFDIFCFFFQMCGLLGSQRLGKPHWDGSPVGDREHNFMF